MKVMYIFEVLLVYIYIFFFIYLFIFLLLLFRMMSLKSDWKHLLETTMDHLETNEEELILNLVIPERTALLHEETTNKNILLENTWSYPFISAFHVYFKLLYQYIFLLNTTSILYTLDCMGNTLKGAWDALIE